MNGKILTQKVMILAVENSDIFVAHIARYGN
jgi:hypothetical protein